MLSDLPLIVYSFLFITSTLAVFQFIFSSKNLPAEDWNIKMEFTRHHKKSRENKNVDVKYSELYRNKKQQLKFSREFDVKNNKLQLNEQLNGFEYFWKWNLRKSSPLYFMCVFGFYQRSLSFSALILHSLSRF